MNLENLSQKQLNELERRVSELLNTMRKARLQNDPLIEALKLLEHELGETRRERFDAANSEYHTY